jgi:hypothetical protein
MVDCLEREGRLYCLKDSQLGLPSGENDLRFFGQTKIIFQLIIIFASTKPRKMPKSFFRNYFTPKQTKHKKK